MKDKKFVRRLKFISDGYAAEEVSVNIPEKDLRFSVISDSMVELCFVRE